MHAPSWLCRELVRQFPDARIGWAGRPAKDADDLNAGEFALVQLYPANVVGSLTNPDVFDELWQVTTRADAHGRAVRVRAERGPIFNRHGGTAPDYDPLFYVPVYKFDFVDQGFPLPKFLSGGWLNLLTRDKLTKKLDEVAEKKGKALAAKMDDHAKEGYSYLKHTMSATGDQSTAPVVAYKHAKPHLKKFYDKKQQNREYLLNYYKNHRG